MISRNQFTEQLSRSIGLPLVKVLTGIRRCGKSSVLALFHESLLAKGIDAGRILRVNMESLEFDGYRDYRSLYRFVKERLPAGGHFLLDEAQEVEGWERLVASLLAEGQIETVVTGSNASLLASELGSLLTGRFLEIPIYPLSFPEYLTFANKPESEAASSLGKYLRWGGFPALHSFNNDEEAIRSYLLTLLDSIIYRDVIGRHGIRDPDGLNRVLSFALDNIGNMTSARRISDYLKSQRRVLSTDSAVNYLHYLVDAFVLYRARRYDIKGKLHLDYSEKYYASDLGLRFGLLGWRPDDISGLVENAVYLELRRRGFQISVGRIGSAEVDFVAQRQGEFRYYQACAALSDPATIEREFSALEAIGDHWPKAIIVMNPGPLGGRSGIGVVTLLDFLMGRAEGQKVIGL
ncbi:MAG: ATP-binding protein [Spirochaetota bacterium]